MPSNEKHAVPMPTAQETATYLQLFNSWTDIPAMAKEALFIHRQLDAHWEAIPSNIRLGMGHRLLFLTLAIAAIPAQDEEMLVLKCAAFARSLRNGATTGNIACMLEAALERDKRFLNALESTATWH